MSIENLSLKYHLWLLKRTDLKSCALLRQDGITYAIVIRRMAQYVFFFFTSTPWIAIYL